MPGFDPNRIISDDVYWEDQEGNPVAPPKGNWNVAGVNLGVGGANTDAIQVRRMVMDNGLVWDSYQGPNGEWQQPVLNTVKSKPSLAEDTTQAAPRQPKTVETSEGIVAIPDMPPGGTGPMANGQLIYRDPNSDLNRENLQADLDLRRRQAAQADRQAALADRQAAQVGMPTPRQARFQDEIDLGQAQALKAQRELLDPFTLAQQQHSEVIQAIQQQLAAGDIDVAEANRLMALSRANIDATLRGTTPFQIDLLKSQEEKDQRTERAAATKQRQDLASTMLGNQMQAGTSLGSSLMSSIFGSKILSSAGPPADFDPFAYSFDTAQRYGGGPELSEMAQAILRGALQQPQGGY